MPLWISRQHRIDVYHILLWKQGYGQQSCYTVTCSVFYLFHCDSWSISNPQSIFQRVHTLFFLSVFLLSPSLSVFLSAFSFFSLCLFHFPSQEDCQPCLPGYYCDAVGLSAPSGECWEGFFCLEGADRPDPPLRDRRGGPCPKGDQIPENLDICLQICYFFIVVVA